MTSGNSANHTQHAPPLRMLFWESTAKCNLACVHCRRLDACDTHEDRDLTTAQAKTLMTQVAKLGRPVFVFSGGEPLMRDDWRELGDYGQTISLSTALATNGTLIDTSTANDIAAAGFKRVAVSLDGVDEDTHDTFRGVQGCFKQALNGIECLRSAGVEVQINATVSSHNAHQLDSMLTLARSVGAVALHLFMLVPVGCGVQLKGDQLSADDYERVLRWVALSKTDADIDIRPTCAPHYYRVAQQMGIDTGKSRGCLAGVSVAFVSHEGLVYPCGYLPVTCGDVSMRTFGDIWADSPVFSELRDYDNLTGKCGVCDFKNVCGGCRARAYSATGDYLSAEPNCGYS